MHLVRRRGSTQNSGHHNPLLLDVEIVDDAVIADTTTPRRSLSFEALDVAAEGILLHRKQGVPNARPVFCRQFLKLFLRGAGDVQVPDHWVSGPRGIASTIPNSPAAARRARPGWALRRDSAFRNRRGALRALIRTGCEILFFVPPRTAAAGRG